MRFMLRFATMLCDGTGAIFISTPLSCDAKGLDRTSNLENRTGGECSSPYPTPTTYCPQGRWHRGWGGGPHRPQKPLLPKLFNPKMTLLSFLSKGFDL